MTSGHRRLLGTFVGAWLSCSSLAHGQTAASTRSDPPTGVLVEALECVTFGAPDEAPALRPSRLLAAATQQQEAPPPVPRHTGPGALFRETFNDFKAFPKRPSTWIILGVGGALSLAVHPADRDINAHLVGHSWAERLWKPGHIIGSAPVMIGVPVGIYLTGRYLVPPATDEPKTNKWSHLGLDLLRAEIVDQAIVQGLKFAVRRTRPNGGKYGFPSGHAGATFALAAVLERHLGYRLSWPTLAIATYVATSRLHDNVHYLSDVLFGAAIGTAAGWTVVGRHGRSSYAFTPVLTRGGFALAFTRTPPS